MKIISVDPNRRKLIRFAKELCALLVLIMAVSGCAHSGKYIDGEYFGESEGYYSNVKVSVTVSSGKISKISIIDHNEPEILADIVFEKLPPMIIKKNGTDVDIISGASYTSKSLIEAVDNALCTALKPE